ncbi:MAG TPA: hypothetical protein DEO40_03475 [Treponema sp.]|nr:hypothetical protein [Treponema sp.]
MIAAIIKTTTAVPIIHLQKDALQRLYTILTIIAIGFELSEIDRNSISLHLFLIFFAKSA